MSKLISNSHQYLDEFKIIKTLGKGYQAEVKLAEKHGKLFAIKKYHAQFSSIHDLRNQITIMKELEHQNITKLYEVRQHAVYTDKNKHSQECFAIILQYIEGGELFQNIQVCGKFTPNVARTYFIMLLDALKYMHSKNIVHRDIKLQNILLDSEFNLKVADFGFSTKIQAEFLEQKLGTEAYMAPEIRTHKYKGKQVDLYASAIVLFIMCSGNQPFFKSVDSDPYYKMFIKENKKFWQMQSHSRPKGFFSQQFKDLINRMLSPNPLERYTMEEVRNHPWVTGDSALLDQISEQFSERRERIKEVKAELQRKELQRQESAFRMEADVQGDE